jgi:hypothetical protein
MMFTPEIHFAELSGLQKLMMAQERIKALKAELKAWQASYDTALLDVLRTAEFSEDRFLQAIHKRGESYREGEIKLIRSARTQRILRREDFIRAYPLEFNQIAKIPITDAERAIGRDALDGLCDRIISYSYEAVDLGKPEAEGK